jgi:hypothetical protein
MVEATDTGKTLPVPAVQKAIQHRSAAPALLSLPAPLPSLPAPGRAYKPALAHEVMPQACHECGQALNRVKPASSDGKPASTRRSRASQKFCSVACARIYRAEMLKLAAPPEAAGRLRQWYTAEIAPRLGSAPPKDIAQTLGVSPSYARNIGTRAMIPHPRHFGALAELVEVAMPTRLA